MHPALHQRPPGPVEQDHHVWEQAALRQVHGEGENTNLVSVMSRAGYMKTAMAYIRIQPNLIL